METDATGLRVTSAGADDVATAEEGTRTETGADGLMELAVIKSRGGAEADAEDEMGATSVGPAEDGAEVAEDGAAAEDEEEEEDSGMKGGGEGDAGGLLDEGDGDGLGSGAGCVKTTLVVCGRGTAGPSGEDFGGGGMRPAG
ncbi:hypothetical protein HDU96_007428 [Phlyctochytrium bullatum]|nr:hypothetical protein HDU96_007428 [Phlyctochytrium bullatum]